MATTWERVCEVRNPGSRFKTLSQMRVDKYPPTDEELAAFAAGKLPRGARHDAMVRHLADCGDCRELAAAVMRWEEQEEAAR